MIGKSVGRTAIGESAPCSKMGRAQVRNGGVRAAYSGRRYRPSPCRGHSPLSGMGKVTTPAHSPRIAQACVQSSGVLAIVPNKGVSISPPCAASTGSSGTAVVARKLARLSANAATHSSGVLLLGASFRAL